MNPQAFVISLRRSSDRVAHVQRMIETCPLPCRRWDAVDGKLLSPDEIADVYSPGLHDPRYPFELNRGEVGCFLSHRGIWQRIVDEALPAGLVLEDDIEWQPGFEDALQLAIDQVPTVGYVQFQIRLRHRLATPYAASASSQLIRPEVIPLGAVAQLITRGAAERLLEATEKFDRPVDTFVQMHWLHGVDVLIATPPSVREISAELGGSLIHVPKSRSSKWKSLSREWQRYQYQRQLHRLYREHPVGPASKASARAA
jgi:glycosyl transferase family 25